jgi:hypothetical protein
LLSSTNQPLRSTKEDVTTFLKWMLDKYRVWKRSTLHEY